MNKMDSNTEEMLLSTTEKEDVNLNCPYLVEVKHNLGLTRLCIINGKLKEDFVGPNAFYCRTGKWHLCPRIENRKHKKLYQATLQ